MKKDTDLIFKCSYPKTQNYLQAKVVGLFKIYMQKVKSNITKTSFIQNLNSKITDKIFRNDIVSLINNVSNYKIHEAFEYVLNNYLQLL